MSFNVITMVLASGTVPAGTTLTANLYSTLPSKLLGMAGRSRRRQLPLAQSLNHHGNCHRH